MIGKSRPRTRIAGLAIAMIALGACVTAVVATSATGAPAQKKRLKLAMVGAAVGNPAYASFFCGALAAAKKLGGIDLTYQAPTDYTAAKGVSLLQAVARTKPDGIAVTPTAASAYVGPVQEIVKSGIPVITWDSSLPRPVATQIASANQELSGATAAKILAKALGHKGTVFVLAFIPGVPVDGRTRGFVKYMKANEPNIKVLGTQYGKADLAYGTQLATAVLRAHPEVTGIYGQNLIADLSVANAVKAVGKTGKIKVVGQDASTDDVRLLKTNEALALVVQSFYLEGKHAVEALNTVARGGKIPKTWVVPQTVLTKANSGNPKIVREYVYENGCKSKAWH